MIAALPKAARPKHYLEFARFASAADTTQDVFIALNGDITTAGYDGLTSLDGISFPVGE